MEVSRQFHHQLYEELFSWWKNIGEGILDGFNISPHSRTVH